MSRPRRGAVRRSLTIGVLSGALVALVAAPSALADSVQSSNWAGYAVHRSGVRFQRVIGTWQQPTAVCNGTGPTYSSVWVGLGGFKLNAKALEQIGSEVDCSPTGRVLSTAWYELVPAPSRPIRMRVDPGDWLSASVIVRSHGTTLTLHDLTRRRTFTRRVHVRLLDVSSAEWIVEAPSECSTTGSCQTLNLADFGTASFTAARATPLRGPRGSISDPRWGLTGISLGGGARRFIGGAAPGPQATPSPLTAGGRGFSVTYQGAPSATAPNPTAQATVAALGRLRLGGARRSR